MTTIWKYTVPIQDKLQLRLPEGAKILHVGNQGGSVQMWVLVDSTAPKSERDFLVIGTGHPVPERVPIEYIGSAVVPPFVWHVFEDLSREAPRK